MPLYNAFNACSVSHFFSIAGSNNVHYNGLKTSLTFHVTSYNSTAVRETEVKTEEELFEGREGQREVWN